MRLPGIGGRRYAVGASVAVSIGSAWTVWCARWIPSVRISHPYPSVRFGAIHFIQGRSRMREIRSYGSVRGVAGDRYPYRDCSKTHELKCSFRPAATPKKSGIFGGNIASNTFSDRLRVPLDGMKGVSGEFKERF